MTDVLLEDRSRSRRRGVAGQVYEAIRESVISGRFNGGTRLTEEHLASLFGVSRTPVREALFTLAGEGLVQPVKGRGFTIPHLDRDEVRDLYELQALIEGYAARRAAMFCTEEEVAVLRELAEQIDAAPGRRFQNQAEKSRWYLEQIDAFHTAVAVASRNRRLPTLFKQVLETPLLLRVFFQRAAEELAQCNRYHRSIACALERRDPEQAEALMRAHILEARDLVVAVVGEQTGRSNVEPAGEESRRPRTEAVELSD